MPRESTKYEDHFDLDLLESLWDSVGREERSRAKEEAKDQSEAESKRDRSPRESVEKHG